MPPETAPDWSPDEIATRFDVSRETLERLQLYVDLLYHWNRRINLVSPKSLTQVWKRHIGDSIQLLALEDLPDGRWVDLGAGAGLPGMIVAVAGDRPVTLVESDRRKAAFLREAARRTGADVEILTARIEDLEPLKAAVISARALAPLDRLLGLAAPHLSAHGVALFLKGQDIDFELTEATKSWIMHVKTIPSLVDDRGCLAVISGLAGRHRGDSG